MDQPICKTIVCTWLKMGDFISFWAFYTYKVGVGALCQVLFLISSSLLERNEGNILPGVYSHRVTVPHLLFLNGLEDMIL